MQERKKRPPLRKAEPLPDPPRPRSEEEEEKYACGLAMDTAIRWMQEGTAPAQVICHFLKIQSTREKMELEKLEHDTELAKAKRDALLAAKEAERKHDEVIKAIKMYSGHDSEWEPVPDDYPDEEMDYRP